MGTKPSQDAIEGDAGIPPELELTDEDILDALAHISGYVDISTEDFRIVYHLAWKHAVQRLRGRDNGGRAE